MLKVTIALHPGGSPTISKTWIMHIWNDGTGNNSIGNYLFKIFRRNTNTVVHGGEVKGFQRLRWSPFYLLYLCLKSVYDDKNKIDT